LSGGKAEEDAAHEKQRFEDEADVVSSLSDPPTQTARA
jgi:hypothetical protein